DQFAHVVQPLRGREHLLLERLDELRLEAAALVVVPVFTHRRPAHPQLLEGIHDLRLGDVEVHLSSLSSPAPSSGAPSDPPTCVGGGSGAIPIPASLMFPGASIGSSAGGVIAAYASRFSIIALRMASARGMSECSDSV